MRRYETIYITLPDLSEEEQVALQEKMRSLIAAQQGELINLEDWGVKKLGYEIKKNKNGRYYLLDYRAASDLVRALERNLRLNDRVLKFLTVKVPRPTKAVAASIKKEVSLPPASMESKIPDQLEGDRA